MTLVGTYGRKAHVCRKVVCCTCMKRKLCKAVGDLHIHVGDGVALISKVETDRVELKRLWELKSMTMICEDWEGQTNPSVLYCLRDLYMIYLIYSTNVRII